MTSFPRVFNETSRSFFGACRWPGTSHGITGIFRAEDRKAE